MRSYQATDSLNSSISLKMFMDYAIKNKLENEMLKIEKPMIQFLNSHNKSSLLSTFQQNPSCWHGFFQIWSKLISTLIIQKKFESAHPLIELIGTILHSLNIENEIKDIYTVYSSFLLANYINAGNSLAIRQVLKDTIYTEDPIIEAILLNNKCVACLNMKKYNDALSLSVKAITTIEPIIFKNIKKNKITDDFNETLPVLLISYLNNGYALINQGKINEARIPLDQGYKMAQKFLGQQNYLVERFVHANELLESPRESPNISISSRESENKLDYSIKNSFFKSDIKAGNNQKKFTLKLDSDDLQRQTFGDSLIPESFSPPTKMGGSNMIVNESLLNNQEKSITISPFKNDNSRVNASNILPNDQSIFNEAFIQNSRDYSIIEGRTQKDNSMLKNILAPPIQIPPESEKIKFEELVKKKEEEIKKETEKKLDELNQKKEQEIKDLILKNNQELEIEKKQMQEEIMKIMKLERDKFKSELDKQLENEKLMYEQKIKDLTLENETKLQEKKARKSSDSESKNIQTGQKEIQNHNFQNKVSESIEESIRNNNKNNSITSNVAKQNIPNKHIKIDEFKELLNEEQEIKRMGSEYLNNDITSLSEIFARKLIDLEQLNEQKFSTYLFSDNIWYNLEIVCSVSNKSCHFKIIVINIHDSSDQILEENIDQEKFLNLFNLIYYMEAFPLTVIIRNITMIDPLIRYGMIPFVGLIDSENKKGKEIAVLDHCNGLCQELKLLFLEESCKGIFQYIGGRNFRLSLFPLEPNNQNLISIEIIYDKISFNNIFKFHKEDKPITIPTLEPAPLDIFASFEPAIKKLESELKKERPNVKIQDFHRITEYLLFVLSITENSTRQVLWIVKDKSSSEHIEFNSFTLFKVKTSAQKTEELNLKYFYHYDNLWKDYALLRSEISRQELICLTMITLKRMILSIPKLEPDEFLDIDDVEIKCEPLREINYSRSTLSQKYMFPLTMTLHAINDEIIGIKCGIYSSFSKKEVGVYLVVFDEYWSVSEKDKNSIPKKKAYLRDEASDYSTLPLALKKKGYAKIFNQMKISLTNKGCKECHLDSKFGKVKVGQLESIFNKLNKS